MEDWQNGPYGKLLKFCDSGTLELVRRVWLSYVPEGHDEKQKAKHRSMVNDRFKKARAFKEKQAPGQDATAIRSLSPLITEALKDFSKLKCRFWDKENAGSVTNPSLVLSLADTGLLHYGTDVLPGFHLSAAYAPLVPNSAYAPATKNHDADHHLITTTRLQFNAWIMSFRDAQKRLTFRFCSSDALTFCYTMQNLGTNDNICANWPRHPHQTEVLKLDGPDYADPAAAPRSFNVIDTSNLIDHLGPLNVLPAATPLLVCDISSTLYSELLVKRMGTFDKILGDLLGGDFPTMTILLGLCPVGYWTNASAVSSGEECLQDKMNSDPLSGQMFLRQGWKLQLSRKRTGSSQGGRLERIKFDKTELIHILIKCYQHLFSHENVGLKMQQAMEGSIDVLRQVLGPRYHRGSFAAFLRYLRSRVDVPNWDDMIETLTRKIERQAQLMVNLCYIQEFYLYSHLYGVGTVDNLDHDQLQVIRSRQPSYQRENDFRSWEILPPVLSITVRVPRSKLRIFTRNKDVVTPHIDAFVESSRRVWQNSFGTVKMCFGTPAISGSRGKDDYAITITQDAAGWGGESDLFLSFWVPAWILFQDSKPLVGLSLQATPNNTETFMRTLGMHLKVFETGIGCENHVYITKQGPNQTGHPILCGTAHKDCQSANGNIPKGEDRFSISITARIDREKVKLSGFTARIDLLDKETRSTLAELKDVELKQDTPCSISVHVKGKTRYSIEFPAPVLGDKSEVSVNKASSYVEVVVPLAARPERRFPGYMFPIFIDNGNPVVWNIPYININRLPILDCDNASKLQWLNPHVSFTFSARERKLRATGPLVSDARVNFKESLYTMYMYVSGIQGAKRCHIFGLDDHRNGGIETLIFVSAARLDPSNRTVVLDAAILPMTKDMVLNIIPLIERHLLGNMLHIKVDDKEKKLWKEVLPAYVERCRDWEHRPDCEYTREGSRVPLTTELYKQLLCSCGNGKFPKDYITGVPHWDKAAKHSVRAAISLPFPMPFVEELLPFGDLNLGREIAAADGASRTKGDSECWNCGKEKCDDGKLLRVCTGCDEAKYCSRGCQRSDWKAHKKDCKKNSKK